MTVTKKGKYLDLGNKFVYIHAIDLVQLEGHYVRINLRNGSVMHVTPVGTGIMEDLAKQLYQKITEELHLDEQP